MKKWFALLLTILLIAVTVFAYADTVSCSAGGFSLTLPDSFSKVSKSSADDPDLELHYSNGSVDMAVYVSFRSSYELCPRCGQPGPLDGLLLGLFRKRGQCLLHLVWG